jgi:DNA-binding NarL/FixJ family response regulator
MVVLDLWLLDKSTNTPDHNGGLKILQLLRATWPNCYVIVYSGHLDQAIKASLKQFEQIAIVDKPVPAWVLTELIDNILVAKEV